MVGTGLDPEHLGFDDFRRRKSSADCRRSYRPSSVIAYAIKARAWFRISISRITDVDWATSALDHLVLLKIGPRTCWSRPVEQHWSNKDKILSDVIKSKGKVRSSSRGTCDSDSARRG